MNIVEDIYTKLDGLNDGPLDLSDEIIDKFGEDIKAAIKSWAQPQKRKEGFYLRMSNIGKPLRRLWFDARTTKENKEIFSELRAKTFKS